MLKLRSSQVGFSIIELMVSITLMAILVMVAAPSLSAYTENSKLRGVTESFMAAVQNARTEAIRRNQVVELVLTTDSPTAANVATTNLSSTAGNWLVRVRTNDAAPFIYDFVQGRSQAEGSGAEGTTTVQLAATSGGSAVSKVSFEGVGKTDLGGALLVNFTSSTAACATAGPIRCLRVRVSTSGQAKSCDPAATAANDTRAC
jgi:type IV fimbrial biogenesis protein FimT